MEVNDKYLEVDFFYRVSSRSPPFISYCASFLSPDSEDPLGSRWKQMDITFNLPILSFWRDELSLNLSLRFFHT